MVKSNKVNDAAAVYSMVGSEDADLITGANI